MWLLIYGQQSLLTPCSPHESRFSESPLKGKLGIGEQFAARRGIPGVKFLKGFKSKGGPD